MVIPEQICLWLRSLGFEAQDDFVPALGISGAAVIPLERAGSRAILKLVPSNAPPGVRERARRERRFYMEIAPALPLRTPALLGSWEQAAGHALILAGYEPARPAAAWEHAQWLQAVRELAQFHAAFWNATAMIDTSWMKPESGAPSAGQLTQARAAWQVLRGMPLLAPAVAPAWNVVEQALAECATMPAARLPRTLCHNDCHAGNILFDISQHLVWADWQEVGVGAGPGDLSFFWQRAASDGASIALGELVDVYCGTLDETLAEPPEQAVVECAMHRSELLTRALEWPFYLRDAAPDRVADHLKRMAVLLDACRRYA